MSFPSDLKTTIDRLLDAQESVGLLMKCLQKLDDKENISLLVQIRDRLNDAGHKIEKALPDYMFDGGVQWASMELGVSIAHMFPAHLNRMLEHDNPEIRQVGVRCGDLSLNQLAKAMQDESKWVKEAALRRSKNGNTPLIQRDQPIGLAGVARIPK